MTLPSAPWAERLASADLVRRFGRVSQVLGLALEVTGIRAAVGELCEVRTGAGPLLAEVVGFREQRLLLMPLGELAGVRPGDPVAACGAPLKVPVGPGLLGRVVDAFGRPVDGLGPLSEVTEHRPLLAEPPAPLVRRRVTEPLATGIRALDALLPLGRGQRVGIFSGSGVGKSVLLGSLAAVSDAEVNVLALVGERAREVREFVERDLSLEARKRSVVVVATSSAPPLVRRQAAFAATVVAEFFRDQGQTVLLMMDSLTRLAMAQREIGLAVGEPPATRGYPPSVFALLPRLLERAGTTAHRGTITGLYTVLVEGDDPADPVADAARAILDGHIVLSRELAQAGHFPAVDVLASVSRLQEVLLEPAHLVAAARVREHLAVYRDARDLIAIGAYVAGSDPRVDRARELLPAIEAFLRQGRGERTPRAETLARLAALGGA